MFEKVGIYSLPKKRDVCCLVIFSKRGYYPKLYSNRFHCIIYIKNVYLIPNIISIVWFNFWRVKQPVNISYIVGILWNFQLKPYFVTVYIMLAFGKVFLKIRHKNP